MSFKNSAFWAIICNFLVSVINILGLKVLSGVLDIDSYGQELYLYSNSIIIGSIFGLGVGKVVNEVQSTNGYYKDEFYKKVMKYSCTLVFFCVLIATILSVEISDILKVRPEQLIVASLILSFYILDNCNRSFLIGRKMIKRASISFLIFTIIGWISAFIMYSVKFDSFFLKGMLVTMALSVAYNHLVIRSAGLSSKPYDFLSFSEVLFDKIVPSILSQLLGSIPQIIISTYLIVFYDASSVAVYVIAMYIFRAMLFIPSGIQRVMLPYLGEVNDNDKINFIKKNMLINFIITLPFLIAVFVASDIISELFSFDVDSARNIFVYTVLAGCISSIVAPVGQIMITMNRYYFSMFMNFVWAILYLTLCYFSMIMGLHIEFIMLSLTISYVVHAMISVNYLKRLKSEISN
ncbi:O-antigen/teichoic acid export membrane protein [Vibrio crassostreae]|uniref:hypothetical protein n=1 Tax=Vibrio crassostreae TaxID=246167 RepID=UPI00104D95ED|nr:hypothetical protein [Vibrio crassostreae]TCN76738.1 O-antigen/teichoic acid export membrane protein [Vibrio crassostreae]TWD36544.1 O-antigen/teichoic acid export membrane protein [Vibrio crassostreae]TWD66926.1 O-antigen/teichoic acid export membrane protein [Vibrio crassostreae]